MKRSWHERNGGTPVDTPVVVVVGIPIRSAARDAPPPTSRALILTARALPLPAARPCAAPLPCGPRGRRPAG
uniref:Uncharacterized protein n=1 Tax=Oryza nivara TaxID=4536 RepID=A0A0E0GHK0_ORYNI